MAVNYMNNSYTMEDELIDLLDTAEFEDFNINDAKRYLMMEVVMGKVKNPIYYGYGVKVHTVPKIGQWPTEQPFTEYPWDEE